MVINPLCDSCTAHPHGQRPNIAWNLCTLSSLYHSSMCRLEDHNPHTHLLISTPFPVSALMKPTPFSYQSFGVSTPFDRDFRNVTSPVFSSTTLGALRLLFAVYGVIVVVITVVFYFILFHDPDSYLSYFTNLTWIGLTAYHWASGIQTIAFVRRGHKSYPLQSWPRFFQLLHVLLRSTIIVYPILVTIVFWSLLASPSTFNTTYSTWSNLSQHALNSAFALFEILLTNSEPSPWIHLVPLILILGGYVGVAYITHATQGIYPYAFLNPSKEHGWLAVYIIGIALGCCVVFCIVKGICLLRFRLSHRYGRIEDRCHEEDIKEWQNVGTA